MSGIGALVKAIDADGSGFVSVEECREFLLKPIDDMRDGVELMLKLTGEIDGELNVQDFKKVLTALMKANVDLDSIDTNDDGKVSKDEFKAVLTAGKSGFTEEQIDTLLEDWNPEKPRSGKIGGFIGLAVAALEGRDSTWIKEHNDRIMENRRNRRT